MTKPKKHRKVHKDYVLVYAPTHPKARKTGYVREHLLIVEEVLGKPIPRGARVHHVDSNRTNNKHSNLVLCQDDKYHHLLHMRQRAIEAGHPPNWRKCWICKSWGDPKDFYIAKRGNPVVCPDCFKSYKEYLKLRKTKEEIE